MTYRETQLFVGGQWRPGRSGDLLEVRNPATEDIAGTVACAVRDDLEEAAETSSAAFRIWRDVAPFERSVILRRGASLLRDRVDEIAMVLTIEQGKVLAESRTEILHSADILDWFAEESKRTYARGIPSRASDVDQWAVKEPVGVVAAFTPWNFPVSQTVRKLGAALASGCSVILKAAEETPAAPAELVRALADAGLPAGVVNLIYGNPSDISSFLIPHPVVRKISFTGSTAVGKQLASLAGLHMKRVTMELGGHAPVIVFEDAAVSRSAKLLAASKYRNAGQVCVSPTRFLIHDSVYDSFVDEFVQHARAIVVGNGLSADSQMGPLANARRVEAVEHLLDDAISNGANILAGGARIGNRGHFFQPTIISDVPEAAKVMSDEPFGPLALMKPFSTLDEAVSEANRLPYGLASYVFTGSRATANTMSRAIESGMVSVNGSRLGLPETPFGGIKDSGYGSEGGPEAMDGYLSTKFVAYTSI